MGFLRNLLGDTAPATPETPAGGGNTIDTTELKSLAGTFAETFKSIMGIVMPIVLSVVLALGVFFCIKLGIAYAKTEKTEDREEAKKRLVGAIIGFGIGIAGAAIMWALFTSPTILEALFQTTQV